VINPLNRRFMFLQGPHGPFFHKLAKMLRTAGGDVWRVAEHDITDIVLYGDTRPIHAEAIKIAKTKGLTIHVFEEGYMRPFWVTYERDGANGHSKLMDLTVPEMQTALACVLWRTLSLVRTVPKWALPQNGAAPRTACADGNTVIYQAVVADAVHRARPENRQCAHSTGWVSLSPCSYAA